MTSVPVIVDTDIGDDVDDAYCLAYLLGQPACELVGITTVRGDTPARAALADAACRAAGRTDVPIVAGAERTVGSEPVTDADGGCAHAEALSCLAHRDAGEFAPDRATDFLIAKLRERPGQITLLAIGQLTNVAALLTAYPEAATLMKRLVMMNGAFFTDEYGSEWNSRCDPVATWIVYRAPGLDLTAIGSDVTERCFATVPAETARLERLGGPFVVARETLPIWARRYERVGFHDPLAAAVIFEPDLCQLAEGVVEVELTRTHVGPLTRWRARRDRERTHRVATSVDLDAFWDHFARVAARWATLGGQAPTTWS